MFRHLQFDKRGMKRICNDKKINSGMMMEIFVYRFDKGEKLQLIRKDKEMAILLTTGRLTYTYEGNCMKAERAGVFTDKPYCLHVCKNTEVELKAEESSEIIVQATYNDATFKSRFYTPNDCKLEVMGETQWGGTAKREVLTIFDYSNAPYSNMVMGEVITLPGKWSSYVPHSHPQPEVYYYKFDKPQGFGACFEGDNAYKVKDGSAALIRGGYTHPQTSAPGYTMYYCWMIRHLPDNPWRTRDFEACHEWLLKEN